MAKGKVALSISGRHGKMGQAVARLLKDEFAKEIELNEENPEIIIDFSDQSALDGLLERAFDGGIKLVIGTTGYSKEQLQKIELASKRIAIFYAENFSIGANLLAELAATSAAKLGALYDGQIIDIHHKHKKDANSGTSLMIQREIKEKSGRELPINSMRIGEVIGSHSTIFASPHEIISLKHEATNRDIFAFGALKAALWLASKTNGLFGMKDLIK